MPNCPTIQVAETGTAEMTGSKPEVDVVAATAEVAESEEVSPTTAAQKKKNKKKKKKNSEANPSNEQIGTAPEEEPHPVMSPEEAKKMIMARKGAAAKSKKKGMDTASKRALAECGGVQRKGGGLKPGTGYFDPPNWDMGDMGGRQENPD